MNTIDTIDPFAGPGGWSVAAAALGLHEVGIELDPHACATRAAAGHLTIRADVAAMPTHRMVGKIRGLIASPPCGTFSAAGKGEGIGDMPLIHQCLDDLTAGRDTRVQLAAACSDPRTPLVAEPLRYALDLRPEWIALEQVPSVLPLWEHIARILRSIGYSAWAGILNAANYGVPQTRKRAILIASRIRTALPPEPTHYDPRKGLQLWGAPWVSMAEALGWGMTERPYFALATAGGRRGGADEQVGGSGARKSLYAERDRGAWVINVGAGGFAQGYERACEDPSPTIRQQSQSWVLRSGQTVAGIGRAERNMDEPAVSITGRADLNTWIQDRPATTVCATDRIAKPGHRDRKGSEAQFQGAVRISIQEAAILQSFPADYPWQGTKTQAFMQVGNAVPPLLALHVLSAATGIAIAEHAAALSP